MSSKPPTLASIISSILAAFSSGRDVLRKLIAKHQARKLRRKNGYILTSEERLLQDSLSKRPQEIRGHYDRYKTKFGNKFRDGDETSNTSLAQTLLRLNTGLVTIIKSFLTHGGNHQDIPHRSLLDLSESTSSQTLLAMSQYQDRLIISKRLSPETPRSPASRKAASQSSGRSTPRSKSSTPRRGQFVRSKSDPSITVEVVTNPEKPNRTGRHKRRKHSSTSSQLPNSRSAITLPDLSDTRPRLNPPTNKAPLPDEFVELKQRPREKGRNPRPISTLTFRSGSTKLGEIPEDRWNLARVGFDDDPDETWEDWWMPSGPLKERRGLGARLKFWRKS